ncbi:MAG: hypothetical protein A3F09_05100 [Chlamydiae bacterium RIFCSPHIGHO2_12_FULL_49_11]|nr:MAG: hypothetical protein A3F09_05100 [Chlamydiae bacterium RIFCSPHIGHO2_12_FULL_49_11]
MKFKNLIGLAVFLYSTLFASTDTLRVQKLNFQWRGCEDLNARIVTDSICPQVHDLILIKNATHEMKSTLERLFGFWFPYQYTDTAFPEVWIISKYPITKSKITRKSSPFTLVASTDRYGERDQQKKECERNGYYEVDSSISNKGEAKLHGELGIESKYRDGKESNFSLDIDVQKPQNGETNYSVGMKYRGTL